MTSSQATGLCSTRIINPHDKINHLECSICHEVLWKPVACQTCETPFCSTCINIWLENNPSKCPNRCELYRERKCPPLVAKLLAELQIKCFHESQGCQETCSYEALEKHENICGFQPVSCSGCSVSIHKQDFLDHQGKCPSIELTCGDCRMVYDRGAAETKHTEVICLKEQVRRFEQERLLTKKAVEELKIQIATSSIVDFADLPRARKSVKVVPQVYKGFRWLGMSYMGKKWVTKKHPESGCARAFSREENIHVGYFQKTSISVLTGKETFTVVFLTVCAAWHSKVLLTMTGHRENQETNTKTATLDSEGPQIIFLEWSNIDKLILSSHDGVGTTWRDGIGDCGGLVLTRLALTI